jgi:hypothetical protein
MIAAIYARKPTGQVLLLALTTLTLRRLRGRLFRQRGVHGERRPSLHRG